MDVADTKFEAHLGVIFLKHVCWCLLYQVKLALTRYLSWNFEAPLFHQLNEEKTPPRCDRHSHFTLKEDVESGPGIALLDNHLPWQQFGSQILHPSINGASHHHSSWDEVGQLGTSFLEKWTSMSALATCCFSAASKPQGIYWDMTAQDVWGPLWHVEVENPTIWTNNESPICEFDFQV